MCATTKKISKSEIMAFYHEKTIVSAITFYSCIVIFKNQSAYWCFSHKHLSLTTDNLFIFFKAVPEYIIRLETFSYWPNFVFVRMYTKCSVFFNYLYMLSHDLLSTGICFPMDDKDCGMVSGFKPVKENNSFYYVKPGAYRPAFKLGYPVFNYRLVNFHYKDHLEITT